MSLRELELLHFRNYNSLKIELPPEGALFYGKNGVGKTNLLEAISVVTLGKSVRGAPLKDIVQKGEQETFVGAFFDGKKGKEYQSIGFSKNKQLTISQGGLTHSKLSSLYEKNRFIYFGPSDIELVTGPREVKRRFIDQIISQKYPDYLQALFMYRKLIKERNSLLGSIADTRLLEVYSFQIAQVALMISEKRTEFFETISAPFTQFYDAISGGDDSVRIMYQPSVKVTTVDAYVAVLNQSLPRDRELGYTTMGIHRDSFTFKVNNHKFVGFGSQGQMRSVALCFKRCSLLYLEEGYDSRVIVAIDDAFSDLDTGRRTLFFEHILSETQLFIALHSKEEIANYTLPLFTITQGEVERAS